MEATTAVHQAVAKQVLPVAKQVLHLRQKEEVDSGPETKAAFIMVAPIGDAGWNYAHDVGRQYAEEMTGVETAYVDAVPEEQLISVLRSGFH